MIRSISLAVALLAASPAWAGSIVMTIENRGSQAVSGIDAFPVSSVDGSIIENNLSGYLPAVAAGGNGTLQLDSEDCGLTSFRVGLLDESKQTISLDTCTQQTLVIAD